MDGTDVHTTDIGTHVMTLNTGCSVLTGNLTVSVESLIWNLGKVLVTNVPIT